MNLPDEPEAAAFLLKLFAEIADRFGLVPEQEETTMSLSSAGTWRPLQNGLRMWTWLFTRRSIASLPDLAGTRMVRIHYLPNGAISFDADVGPAPGEIHGPWMIYLPDDGARTARALAEMDRPRLFRYLDGHLFSDEKRGFFYPR